MTITQNYQLKTQRGFDVGTRARLVGTIKDNGGIDTQAMSELAVS